MLVSAFVLAASCSVKVAAETTPCIEVSGSATLNIVPDRMTVRIGIQEYTGTIPEETVFWSDLPI